MLYVYLYGGLAGALITFIVAVILFIKLDIIEVIYDLLGIRRRRRKPKKKKKWDKKPSIVNRYSKQKRPPFSL